MDETVRIDVLRVLEDSSKTIEQDDIYSLKELSNHTIHNSLIFQDEDSVTIAVIVYTLAKVFERDGKVDKSLIPLINNIRRSLFDRNLENYNQNLKKLYDIIKNKDAKNKLYIQQVIEQAEIKKGSKIYDHGVSLARSAEILGVSQWELMSYVGKTKMSDANIDPINLRKRISIARKIFGGE